MNNKAIAKTFQDIADLLELKAESPFKVRAYQRAARAIDQLPQEVAMLDEQGRLRDIPGIGESLAQKIDEMLTTGRSQYYEELKAEFPPGITALMDIPSVGPKTAARLSKELGISTVEELEQALLDGRVASLPRMGEKTAENILHHLQTLRTKERRIPLGEALPIAEEIVAALRPTPGLHNLTPAGSLRRLRETIGDIDIIGTADDPDLVTQTFVRLPQVREVLARGSSKASVIVANGLQIDLRLVEHESFGSLLQHFTGSKDHNIALRERAQRRGWSISEYGLTHVNTGKNDKFLTEEAFYAAMGLPYIPPELREAQGEIETAEQGRLPHLIGLEDIKGDLHVHSDWSDGHQPLETMVRAAQARGYQYVAIADHSVGRGIAGGLNAERLHQQIQQIKELKAKLGGIHVLTGIEVDIRADGSLDFPDELLAELDVVTASVHSSMGQEEAKMTERLLKALRNPHVDIIGHPTCRILGEREPVAVDMEQVLQGARETGTAMEINANPHRLDLRDTHVMRARELGVKLVINTDAHDIWHLDFMRFGVGVARRGWCQREHILNTSSLETLLNFLRRGAP